MTVPWIDSSVPIYSGMVHWPDNAAVLIERMLDMSRGHWERKVGKKQRKENNHGKGRK
jgi:kynurenine formamidase